MTTVAQIKEKLSGDAKKNVTDIIDPKIFASVNGLSDLSQTVLEIYAASRAKALIESPAISKAHLSALAYAEEFDSKQREFFKNQMAGIAERTQTLANARVADIQAMLGNQDNLKKIAEGFAVADAKAQANATRLIETALGPSKDIAESFQGISAANKTPSYVAAFVRMGRAEEALFGDFDKALRDSLKGTVANVGSALLANVGYSSAELQASAFVGLHNYLGSLDSATAASAARSIESMNARFVDLFTGAATSAQMANWFAMPESRYPFSRTDRVVEPELAEVRVSKAGTYIEIEPDQSIEAVHIADMDWQVIMSTILKTGKATPEQVISFAEHFTTKDKPGPQEPPMEIKMALNEMYETLKRKHGNGMTQQIFVTMHAAKIWACSLSTFERYRKDVKQYRQKKLN